MGWRVGIDENGLGPWLGPLIVTAVMARTSPEADERLAAEPSQFLHQRLADSKKLVDHHHVALGEAWARMVCRQMGQPAQVPAELVQSLSLYPKTRLEELCAGQAKEQCWASHGELFEATPQQLQQAEQDLQQLGQLGIEVLWARCAIVCTRRINQAQAQGHGRFDVDLGAMEELMLAARAAAQAPIVSVCGKVGGLQRYLPKLQHLDSQSASVLEECRALSRYEFPQLGVVHFARDADGLDPLVALASLIGKAMRELLMGRIVRYYQRQDPSVENASGYNDPVTIRFVRATEPSRQQHGIVQSCFCRNQGSRSR